MDIWAWIGLFVAAVIVVALIVVTVKKLTHHAKTIQEIDHSSADPTKHRYCFIINPSKKNVELSKATIKRVLEEEMVTDYTFKYTTIANPGNLQAQEAINEGYNVIVPCGGDGTIRSVCCQIAKHNANNPDIEVGIVPLGTGNVLAHNLEIPILDTDLAVRMVLHAKSKKFDVGLCERKEDAGFEHAFLVIAGAGFDANLVKRTNPKAKKIVGPFAYYYAGIKEAFRKKPTAELEVTTADDETLTTTSKLRTVMVGNCGRIPGFKLIPDAKYDDGILDVAAVDTTAGLLGWMQLGTEIFMQNLGIENNSKYKIGRIDQIPAKKVTIKFNHAQQVQLDGDLIGHTKCVTFRVIKHAINLRF